MQEVTAAPQAPAITLNVLMGLGRQLRLRKNFVLQMCLPLYTDSTSMYLNTSIQILTSHTESIRQYEFTFSCFYLKELSGLF